MTTLVNSIESKQHITHKNILIDISEQATSLGYAVPVAMTQAVWDKYIKSHDCEFSKLKNILLSLVHSIHRSSKRSVINFRVFPIPGYGIALKTKFVVLKARILRDSEGNPKIVIMLPKEQ